MTERVQIAQLPTGVPGLDDILGGGLPEFSFNLVAGGPGCGKTTLMHQLVFANATVERPALYFTILGEPPLKMLRYQQQFSFFDMEKLDGRIRFVHLGDELQKGGLGKVLETIVREVSESGARFVVVDSFRSATRELSGQPHAEFEVQHFVQQLALHLTSAQATTFLVGEYLEHETNTNPLFTIADGILWLYQSVTRNSVVRRLQMMKMRGQEQVPGFHTFKISNAGVRVYPRMPNPAPAAMESTGQLAPPNKTGVAGLDDMLGGGVPAGYSMLVVGPSGSGKSVLTTQFILRGIQDGEPGIIAVFEKRPEDYVRTTARGGSLEQFVTSGKLKVLHIRPLDLSLDETLDAITASVRTLGAKRVVLDSVSGLELALAPQFREDFRESLYRMVGGLTALGVTVMMTVEITDAYDEFRLSSHGVSFLSDGIILQRYAEAEGRLRKLMTVIKLRGHEHSTEFREYKIGGEGIEVEATPTTLTGFLAGRSVKHDAR